MKNNTPKTSLEDAFKNYVLHHHFPCIMAQSVFKTEHFKLHAYQSLASKQAADKLLNDLEEYLEHYDFNNREFFTFIAAFPDEESMNEHEFEKKLWQQLGFLHQADRQPWDPEVSPDPESEHFSFSLAGRAFYIVGLHPGSSRIARQSPCPAIVFNLHFQFEKLREMGMYTQIRDRIRKRDIALQGNINPMVKDFGVKSEARQYSGRAVDNQWKCPFHSKNKK